MEAFFRGLKGQPPLAQPNGLGSLFNKLKGLKGRHTLEFDPVAKAALPSHRAPLGRISHDPLTQPVGLG